MRISTINVIKIMEHSVALAGSWEHVNVVNITLRSVYVNALHVSAKRTFNSLTYKCREIGRNLASTDNVGVIRKVNESDAICTLALKSYYVYACISRQNAIE